MFPQIDADNVMATLEMPQGTPVEQTERVVERIEEAAITVQRNIDANRPADKPSIFKHIASSIGTQPETQRGPDVTESMSGSHIAEVNIELLEGEKRDVPSSEIEERWRQQVGQIPRVSSLVFTSALMTVGKPIDVELSHDNFDTLLVMVERLKEILDDFEGMKDITDSFEPGKMELKLELTEQDRTTGLTLAELAGQVRQDFYGEEVQRIQRGRNDIRVMVRYPLSQRKSLSDLETMRIRLSDGTEVPFETVARVTQGRGYAAIDRAERTRVVHVRADVDNNVANANEINGTIFNKILPRLESEYPELMFRFAGEQEEQQETTDSLKSSAFIALFAIFALLAVQFRSYAQPVIIMMAIPFGRT
jgi:multidrug efflux pump subunit AcrB